MRIAPDTNVLVRVLLRDDPGQAERAEQALHEATGVALTIPALCELVWVMRSAYQCDTGEIVMAIRSLINSDKVEASGAVEAGLLMLEAGGDFADGVIAHEGLLMGADRFVSFDRRAVSMLRAQGVAAALL